MHKLANTPVQHPDPFELGLDIPAAHQCLAPIVRKTPLQYNANLSRKFGANVFLKREDLQVVRSYKLRGAYNMMAGLDAEQKARGVVCASAGNHAQGFAYSCQALGIKGVVFMPVVTPNQKVRQTEMFGGAAIRIELVGDSFDDCAAAALAFTQASGMVFIPPFDHPAIVSGQATVGVEITHELAHPDYVFAPVGGGGLCAGIGAWIKHFSPQTKLIAVEPAGAPSLKAALAAGHPVVLDQLERFVDGAAVKRMGDFTFPICQQVVDEVCLVNEGQVCSTILQLYNEEAIVVEPAGALSIAALSHHAADIKGKNVVCIVSGSNNDIDRMQEIKERSLQYEGLKHYFLISFAQRPGALKTFVNEVLGPTDDITRFEYMQKHNKESGPALVGIELKKADDYARLLLNLEKHQFQFTALNKQDQLYAYLV